MPKQPRNYEDLMTESLWVSIEHGLGKLAKYKRAQSETMLVLEDDSLSFIGSPLQSLNSAQCAIIADNIDYIFCFDSQKDKMIAGHFWKEQKAFYDEIPSNRRFQEQNGRWKPQDNDLGGKDGTT